MSVKATSFIYPYIYSLCIHKYVIQKIMSHNDTAKKFYSVNFSWYFYKIHRCIVYLIFLQCYWSCFLQRLDIDTYKSIQMHVCKYPTVTHQTGLQKQQFTTGIRWLISNWLENCQTCTYFLENVYRKRMSVNQYFFLQINYEMLN